MVMCAAGGDYVQEVRSRKAMLEGDEGDVNYGIVNYKAEAEAAAVGQTRWMTVITWPVRKQAMPKNLIWVQN